MAVGAQVENIDVLARFKVALIKFMESCQTAIGDADSDIQRTLSWLEHEQFAHWTGQIRHRADALAKAQEAYRQKKLYKDSTGHTQSAIEEMKAVQVAQKRLAEAHEKLAAVKSSAKKLQKEGLLYKGQVQRFATTIQSDLPNAVAHLGALLDLLKQYAAVQMTGGTVGPMDPSIAAFFNSPGGGGMSRSPDQGNVPDADAEKFIKLRKRTPSAQMRPTIPLRKPEEIAPWPPAQFDEKARQIFSGLAVKWVVPEQADKVVIGPSITDSPELFLERAMGVAPGDSGWYIGTVAAPPPAAVLGPRDRIITIKDALALRPDLAPLFGLPPGTLAVVGANGVEAVLDPENNDIWAAAQKGNEENAAALQDKPVEAAVKS